jgi:hypothetical protein
LRRVCSDRAGAAKLSGDRHFGHCVRTEERFVRLRLAGYNEPASDG